MNNMSTNIDEDYDVLCLPSSGFDGRKNGMATLGGAVLSGVTPPRAGPWMWRCHAAANAEASHRMLLTIGHCQTD